MASPTKDETEVSLESLRGQQILWDPSDPSYKDENKSRDAPLQIAEVFCRRCQMETWGFTSTETIKAY